METTLEQLGPLEWQLTLGVDGKAIAAEVERRLGELQRKARVPGFRPGKAPPAVLRRMHGSRLSEQAWERTAQAEVRRELAERGLRPAVAPVLERVADGRGVSARFEVFPQLPQLQLDQLEVRRPVVEITEADVDFMLGRFRARARETDEEVPERDEVRQTLAEELAEAVAEELAVAVENALLAAHPDLELPAGLLAEQIRLLRVRDADLHSASAFEAEARRLLGVALLLAEAARQEGLRSDPAELWQETERLAAAENPRHVQDELDQLWADSEAIQEIEDRLLRQKVVAAVLARARVTDERMSVAELAQRRRDRLEAF